MLRIKYILKQIVDKSFSAGKKVGSFALSKTVPFIIGIIVGALSFALAPFYGPVAIYIGFASTAAGLMWYSSRKNDEVYNQLKEACNTNDTIYEDLENSIEGREVLFKKANTKELELAKNSSSISSYGAILKVHKVGDALGAVALVAGNYLQNQEDYSYKVAGSVLGASAILYAGTTHVAMAKMLRNASNNEQGRKDILNEMRTEKRIKVAVKEAIGSTRNLTM